MADSTDQILSPTFADDDKAQAGTVYRHPLPARLFHWINALCFVILLMSGLQIFNAYPRLHWGHTGYFDQQAFFEITGDRDVQHQNSWIAINGKRVIGTTGLLGVAQDIPDFGVLNIAFPGWMTLPQGAGDLHNGRGWHFLAAYLFIMNLAVYMVYGFASGRFRKTLLPSRNQIGARAILRDLWMHLRLKHATGLDAARYNLLQKLAYIAVIFGLLPLMILTGMTQSPTALMRFPWLIDLFGGRQTARTIHFIGATSLFLFLLVHIFQLFVAGIVNETRSMITGWFRIPEKER